VFTSSDSPHAKYSAKYSAPLVAAPTVGLWRVLLPWGLACLVSVGIVAYLGLTQSGPSTIVSALISGLSGLAAALLLGFVWTWGRYGSVAPSAKYLLNAADKSPHAHLITTSGGSLIYANAAFHAIFSVSREEGSRKSSPLETMAGHLIGGTEADEALQRLRNQAALGAQTHDEFSVMGSRTNAPEWKRITVQSVGQSFGGWGTILWVVEDVTARHQIDIVLRREEEVLADLLDQLPAGFFSADANGRIIYANQILKSWLGLSDDENLVGRSFSDFVALDDDDSNTPVWEEGEVDVSRGEVALRTVEGVTFKVCLIQSQQTGGAGDMVYSRSVVLKDMAWRREGVGAEVARWQFEEAPVGIVMIDLQGNITDCNRAFLSLLGVHRDAVAGQPFSDRLIQEDRGEVGGVLSKIVMGASRAAHLEVRMPASRERELVVSLYASRIDDDDGDITGLVLHFIDATEQKHLEVQFAQSQKMQAVGQLAGGVAHDFNNLLTAMIGFCDLLLERHGPGDPSFADIMQIKQNSNRATNLVRQLLAFSRKQTLEPELVDVSELLGDISNLLGRLIGETIDLNIEHGRDVGLIRVDRGQFDQVIINLAVNARDAMPGGGAVTIRTNSVTLEKQVSRAHEVIPAGDYVTVEVVDTGSGISPQNINHIFEPFFSTKDVGAGTGLGLSTVYGIVHQSDGFIFVDSGMGAGTTFIMYLPRTEAGSGEVLSYDDEGDPVSREDQVRFSPKDDGDTTETDLTGEGTVLLVEDEDAVRMFGSRALTNKGYTVLEADNGEAALDVINGTDVTIDLIVSDVVMPGMDGHTLVRLVRHELPNVKVILMSGYAEDVFIEEIDRDPDIHFLPKPFSLKKLAGKVKEVMEG
jgi:two-component system cell cycle sensor histidine kinase/response regulator CckA